MKQYKVIRSYHNGKEVNGTNLDDAFKEGWQFERASDYVPVREGGKATFFGYIEYILSKEMPETPVSTMQRITMLEGGQVVPEEWVKTINALGYEICSKQAVEMGNKAIEFKSRVTDLFNTADFYEDFHKGVSELMMEEQNG